MHGLMQMYYFGPKDYSGKEIGINKELRENYRNHKWFETCDKFCRDFDLCRIYHCSTDAAGCCMFRSARIVSGVHLKGVQIQLYQRAKKKIHYHHHHIIFSLSFNKVKTEGSAFLVLAGRFNGS